MAEALTTPTRSQSLPWRAHGCRNGCSSRSDYRPENLRRPRKLEWFYLKGQDLQSRQEARGCSLQARSALSPTPPVPRCPLRQREKWGDYGPTHRGAHAAASIQSRSRVRDTWFDRPRITQSILVELSHRAHLSRPQSVRK